MFLLNTLRKKHDHMEEEVSYFP